MKHLLIFAGPCGVLPEEEMRREVEFLAQFRNGAHLIIRAGAYKGQLYPGKKMINGKWVATGEEYQGPGAAGVGVLAAIERDYGLETCTELQNARQVHDARQKGITWAQVGTRHMGNLPLLRSLRNWGGPVLLKRGLGNTIHEWVGAAEHLRHQSDNWVVLCERGIATHENTDPRIRWRPDVLAIPQIKADYPEYKVILDVTHSTGRRDLALPMARAAIAAGADGIMIEVMERPEESMTDAAQTVDHAQLTELMDWISGHRRCE